MWFTGSSRCSTGEGRPTNLFLIFLTPSSHYTNTTEIIKCPVRMNRLADREDLVFFFFSSLFPPSGLMELYWLARQKTTLHLERIFCHRSDKEREGEKKSHNPNSRLLDCAEHIRLKAVGAPTRLVPPGMAKRLGTLEPRIGHRPAQVEWSLRMAVLLSLEILSLTVSGWPCLVRSTSLAQLSRGGSFPIGAA